MNMIYATMKIRFGLTSFKILTLNMYVPPISRLTVE